MPNFLKRNPLYALIIIGLSLLIIGGCDKKEPLKPEVGVDIHTLIAAKNRVDQKRIKEKEVKSSTDEGIEETADPILEESVSKEDPQADKKAHTVKIVIPDEVKDRWEGVVLTIQDKESTEERDITIRLGDAYQLEGSDLKIKALHFFPDFRMDALTITSKSNKPVNPALNLIIYQDKKEVFTGWIFSKYPDIHSFQHNRYRIKLKAGVERSNF